MNNKPVAWMREDGVIAFHKQKEVDSQGYKWIPLYTHPHPDNLGLAESIIKQQQAEIKTLTKFLDETCQIGKFIVWNSTDKEQEK